MIIVKLRGGLGNQLFQYSFGRYLANKHNVPLKLDVSWYEGIPDRQYDLAKYNIQADIATTAESAKYDNIFNRLLDRMRPFHKQKVIRERSFTFDKEALLVGPHCMIDGYWQSEKYFKSIAEIIKRDLSLKNKPVGKNKTTMDVIDNCDAVAILIRRGDYVTNQATNQFHGLTPLDFYHDAVKELVKTVKKPHFFIFSDDQPWVKANLKLKYPMTFIEHNDAIHAYENIRLASHCKHFIIANSTFSWWSVWLSSYKDKIVIAPKEWFKNKSQDDRDLVPKSWRRI